MWGDCEQCGTTAELDCYFNPATGEELYLCDRCGEHINDSEDD